MAIIAPVTHTIPPQQTQAGPTPRESHEQQLRIDQVVRATVSEGGQEKIWLNIGQERFRAETEIPLRTGLQLTLQVSKTTPRLEFKVLSDPVGDRIRQGLHLLKGSWPLFKLPESLVAAGDDRLEGLEAWSRILKLQTDVTDRNVNGGLARFLGYLGMDYEALLAQGERQTAAATLKSLLTDVTKTDSLPKELAGDNLEHFSSLFELWQLIRLKMAQQSVEFWPLPLPQFEQGFLRAERGGGDASAGENEDTRSWRVTVNLQLAGFGPVQIDFLWENSGLFLRFQCATPEQVSLLNEKQEELKKFVSSLPLEGVSVSLGGKEPATALVSLLAGEGVFDARV